MNRTSQLTTLLLTTISLTGRGLDALEGHKSDYQIAQERRAALTSAFVAPPIQEPAQAAIEVAAPVQQCFPEFRIRRCSESGEAMEW